MESIDQKILSLLMQDGRMSYTDIGRETGLSTSAAQQRVRRLEQRGIITGYKAVVDPIALGKLLTAFVQVSALDPTSDDAVPENIKHLPEVVSCFSIAGSASHVLKVQVATPLELDRVLSEIRCSANAATQTNLILSTAFADRPFV